MLEEHPSSQSHHPFLWSQSPLWKHNLRKHQHKPGKSRCRMTPELGLLWRGPTRLGKVPWHRQHGGWHVRERVMMITRSQKPSHPLAAPWAGKGLTSCCLSPLWKNSLGQTSAVMTESWLAEVILGLCGRYIGHQGNHKSWINNPVLIVEIYKMKKSFLNCGPVYWVSQLHLPRRIQKTSL